MIYNIRQLRQFVFIEGYDMNLKEKRKEKKLTQKQVADLCGITQVSYSYYEVGKRNPKPAMLKKFASVLDCTVDELLKDPKEAEDG
jgi:transcriptional regulator with XRE-family HTH domain